MVALSTLWLPILLSAVIVFVASSIVHMVLPWHRSDFAKLPDEDRAMDALRPLGIAPGDYLMPMCSNPKEMGTPEFMAKMSRGPVAMMTVVPNGPPAMRSNLIQWFVYLVVVGVLVGYVASRTLPAGTHYLRVFQIAGATAFIAYAAGMWPFSIWYRRKWSTTVKSTIDAGIYALLTAGTFGWLWPH